MISYKEETITPADAIAILEGNCHNRNINQRHVNRIAATMKRGEWKLNGEAIKLNGNKLLDGQHRLWGCVESDTPFETLVIRGLPKTVQKVIDTGMIRSGAHHFQMEGETYASLLSQTVNKFISYQHGVPVYREGVTNVYLEKELRKHPEIREYVNHYGGHPQNIMPKSVAAACHYIFSRLDSKGADKFMSEITDGVGLKKNSPSMVLREKLIRDLTATRKIPIGVKYALVIKAWNWVRKEKECKQINFRTGDKPEPFPRAM